MGLLVERRGRMRFRVRLPFVLRNDGQEVRGVTRNVSLLGIASYTQGPLSPAQPVQCFLELSSRSQPIVANGTIIRCTMLTESHPDGPYETGVFFKEFEGRGETTLTRYLERIVRKEETAIRAGYKAFRQKLAARRRRRRLEELRKKKRRVERLRRRRQRLAREKRRKSAHA